VTPDDRLLGLGEPLFEAERLLCRYERFGRCPLVEFVNLWTPIEQVGPHLHIYFAPPRSTTGEGRDEYAQ